MEKVLITGGSGFLGTKITNALLARGSQVVYLSTQKKYKRKGVSVYYWNPREGYVDPKAFDGVTSIIHLAGAGIAAKRWTAARKKVLLDSRVDSATLLTDFLGSNKHTVTRFIGASAIGYYGESEHVLEEDAPKGNDFLAEICAKWEASYTLSDLGIKQAIFRVGLVLSNDGGALPEMMKTLPLCLQVLGDGKQLYSWIHVDDLVSMFLFALEKEDLLGVYNAVAPEPRTQKEFVRIMGKLKGAIVLPAPKFVLQLILGEMRSLLLSSQNVSSKKIQKKGFEFKFEALENALDDLL